MALKAKINEDTWKGLPEPIQAEYTEKDGSFVLDVTSVDGLQLADVGKLQSALTSEREAAREAKRALKEFSELDMEPGKLREAVQFQKDFQEGKLSDEQEERLAQKEAQLSEKFETQRAQLEKKYNEQAGKLQGTLETRSSQLKSVMLQGAVDEALRKHGGKPALLRPVVLSMTRMREGDDGKFVTEVLGEDGNPRLSTRSTSGMENMTIDEFVESLKDIDDYAPAFDSSGASGGGASGSGGGGSGGGSAGIKLSSSDARNPALYRAAKERAEKAGVELQITGT